MSERTRLVRRHRRDDLGLVTIVRRAVSVTERTSLTVEEFWAGVTYEPNTGCWIYADAPIREDQYGSVIVEGVTQGPHRHAIELTRGRVLTGHGSRRNPQHGGKLRWALHRCHNKWCVNPDHLYAGTPSENGKDSWRDPRRVNFARRRAA